MSSYSHQNGHASMDHTDIGSEREEDSGIESGATDQNDNTLYIRISIPELKLQKCLQFNLDDTVWQAKQVVLGSLGKDLRDGLNYGMYSPPINGKAGKFLEEERPLRDYPLPGPIGFLEFKYKRRVYKLMQINPRRLKQLHTKANLKQFMEYVRKNDTEKVVKYCNKGLDPNFYEHETGETPLTVASALLKKPRTMILTLIGGGCHIDFRSRDSLTPMHKAAKRGNYDAIKTLLDLGASPNYKDSRGLTPLYYTVCCSMSALCTEALLHDHALIGCADDRGWTEVHHACKAGKVQHLEHLLFYGAEMNIQNSSGNTPLHICAVNNQESCARVLLFRGAEKNIQNYANQDAFQVAVISGNNDLANIIKSFQDEDVVPFQEMPHYNEKRRMTTMSGAYGSLQRSRSNPSLHMLFMHDSQQSSPVPSSRSAHPPYLSSNGGWNGYESDSPRSMSICSVGSLTGSANNFTDHYCTLPHNQHNNNRMSRSVSADMLNRRSSMPAHMYTGYSNGSVYAYPKQRLYPAMPGREFICVQTYKPQHDGDLYLRKGDFVEVISVGEQGYWEGRVENREGWFPSRCVEEMKPNKRRSGQNRSMGDSDSVVIRRDTVAALARTDGDHAPKTVVLQKGKTGFGFVLRGAKSQTSATSTLDFAPTPDFPALQYLDRVDKGSPADRAGLKPGDFLLEINDVSVVNATHERTVRLIKQSGDTLAMKVVTVKPLGHDGGVEVHMDGTRTLPTKKKAGVPSPPTRNPNTSLTTSVSSHAKTTIEGLMELEKLDHTLSQYDNEDQLDNSAGSYSLNAAAGAKYADPNNKTASIGRRSQRLSVPLDELFDQPESFDAQRSASNQPKPIVNVPRTYNSPREMKAYARGGNGNLERAHSTPNLIPADARPHVTSIDLEEPQVDYNRSPTVTNVRLSTVPSNDRVITQDGAVYAVPFKNHPRQQDTSSMHYQEAGLSIHISGNKSQDTDSVSLPPHPSHPPPLPPNRNNGAKDASLNSSDSGSSFRPNKSAHTNKQPAPKPPSVHSRSSSLSSNVSSMSSHSEQRNHNAHQAQAKPVYEPEPDYDEPKPVVTSLRAAREAPKPVASSTANKVSLTSQVPVATQSHTSESPVGSVRSTTTPKSQTSMSDFSNQIKLAAAAREQRAKEEEAKPKRAAPAPVAKVSPPPPPPPSAAPPPPPPPPVQPPADPVPVQKAPVPAHVQKQLEANRKREESHAALMAAVAKRRNLVDNPNADEAESIEARINKSKSSTPVEPKAVEIKEKSPPLPAPVSSLKQAHTDQRASPESQRSLRSPMNDSFTAKAEQARQQYLAKKGISTLERRKAEGGLANGQANKPPPPPVRSSSPDRAPALAGLASVIAQKATQRQKSYENLEEKMNQSHTGYKLLDTRTNSSSSANTSNRNSSGSSQGNINNNNSVLSDNSTKLSTHDGKSSVANRARLFEEKSPSNRNNTSVVLQSQKQSINQGLSTSSSVTYSSPMQSSLANGGMPSLGDIEIVPPPPVFEHSTDQFEIPAIAPPPPGFDDGDFLPPPTEFGTSTPTAVATVRNGVVTKKTYTSRM